MREIYFNVEIHSIHFSVQFICRLTQNICYVDTEMRLRKVPGSLWLKFCHNNKTNINIIYLLLIGLSLFLSSLLMFICKAVKNKKNETKPELGLQWMNPHNKLLHAMKSVLGPELINSEFRAIYAWGTKTERTAENQLDTEIFLQKQRRKVWS